MWGKKQSTWTGIWRVSFESSPHNYHFEIRGLQLCFILWHLLQAFLWILVYPGVSSLRISSITLSILCTFPLPKLNLDFLKDTYNSRTSSWISQLQMQPHLTFVLALGLIPWYILINNRKLSIIFLLKFIFIYHVYVEQGKRKWQLFKKKSLHCSRQCLLNCIIFLS